MNYEKCAYVMKMCGKCGEAKHISKFNKHKQCKYGVENKCKSCKKEYNRNYYENNKETIVEKVKQYCENNKEKKAEYNKQYYENNKETIAEQNKQYYENNKETIAERHKQYYENNKETILEQKKQYYENNKETIAEQNKQYYENNKEQIKQYYENNKETIVEKRKQYYENNKETIAERHKQYYENNKEQIKQYYENNKETIAEKRKQYRESPQGQIVLFNASNRRRSKLENQGNGINKDQWLEMMKFFGFRCAYSGISLSKNIRSIDHIVALDNGGLNEIWNVVPMLKNYNSSKKTKDMEEWYKKQDFYSEERLQKIYEWQEYAWNKWGNKKEE